MLVTIWYTMYLLMHLFFVFPYQMIGSPRAETLWVLVSVHPQHPQYGLASIYRMSQGSLLGSRDAVNLNCCQVADDKRIIKRKEQVTKSYRAFIDMLCKGVMVSTGYITRKDGDSHFCQPEPLMQQPGWENSTGVTKRTAGLRMLRKVRKETEAWMSWAQTGRNAKFPLQ